ncbi:Uncharacterised protein r2_g3863 [Pycnogonum litorale]
MLVLLFLTAYYMNSKNVQHINFAVILFSNGLIAVIVFSLFVFPSGLFYLPTTQTENLYLFGLLTLGLLGRCLFNKSLTCGKPFSTKIGRMVDIPTSYFLQCTIQKKYPSILSVLGAILIVLSSVIFSSRDFIRKRQEEKTYEKLQTDKSDDDM